MTRPMTRPVSFVSSGPGDPQLLTLKAVDRLRAAQVVLFDDLSAGAILDYAAADADLIGVGKRAGRNSPRQDHVSRLLVDYAQTGLRVVRLKSGDCTLFGRLEEEITALRVAGIAFEIIPGVTSACAAAAAAGLPLTRRLVVRRVQFLTGRDVAGALPGDLNLAALVDPGATTILFKARRTFPTLAEKLFAAGLRQGCPALLAENISRPDQRLHRTTVRRLAEQLRGDRSSDPAVILFGDLAAQDADEKGEVG